ncbi:MAG: pilus assembly protein [Deltaproteobacteria bacterium]|nr:pilus assembly protein [Deltaproteobacteria bacterium]
MKDGVQNERGQVAILFALVFTFMFILFAFVVDFAHLINNKINLQIAADTAAYTGAAWQARTLNQIGQVNYHLRQDFKELAMRINVTHARHNREFPRGNGFIRGGNGQSSHQPFVCQQAHGYRSLSGVSYQKITNLCANADPRTGGLPPIVVPPVFASFDPFQVALNQQLTRIRDIADTQCRAAAFDNRALVNHLAQVYINRAQFHANQIRQLETFLNEDMAAEEPSESANHPLMKSVYETVRRNLSLSNRQQNFQIDVLRPNGNRYLDLRQYATNAKFFYYDFSTAGSGCVAIPKRTDSIPIIAGFEKQQDIMTYFAVKVSAKPRLLFMPAKWVESAFPNLEAFSAAKPFGSRIGPKGNTDFLVPTPGRPNNANPMVNFSFVPNDDLGLLNAKRLALFDRFHPFNDQGRPDGNQNTGWPEPDRTAIRSALQLVRAPTLFDSMFYTVFPDPGNNINNDYIESDFALALFPDFLEASAPDNTSINTPDPRTDPYFRNLSSQNRGPGWIQINAPAGGGGGDYGNYAEEQLGSHSTTGVSQFDFVGDNPNEFGFANREQIHSGWTPDSRRGRIGYSVKFISFDGLMRFLEVESTAGGKIPLANKPTGDPNLNKILH